MTVERVRVGQALRLERRPVEPSQTVEYVSIGVRSFGKGIFHYEPTSGDQLGKLRFFEVVPGRLVVSNIKGWEGAVAVSTDADAGCIASNRFLTYVPVDDSVDTRWVRWYLLSDAGIESLQQASPGSADRNRTLAIGRFEALKIPLPPIDEQRRVAAALDRVSAGAAELRWRSERAALLNNALGVSLARRPDLDDTAKARAGWRRTPLREVMAPSTAQLPVEPEREYLIAGIYSFGRGLIDRGPIKGAETSYKSLTMLTEGDVVVSKLNGWEGAVAVVDQAFEGFHVSSEYPTFVLDRSQLRPDFFAGIAQAPSFWDDLNRSARGSMVRRRRINPAEFLATEVWLPPADTQEEVTRSLATATEAGRARLTTHARIDALVPAALNAAFASIR